MVRSAARIAAVLSVVLACSTAWPAARDWRAVPGAEDLELEMTSVQQQGNVVTAWVRSLASTGALDRLVREPGRQLPAYRQAVVLAQADCRKRNVQSMALLAYGAGGVPVWSTSVPGRGITPDIGDAIAWLYDSLCEMGRAASN